MSEQLIANGQYRLQLAYRGEVVTAMEGAPHLALIPEGSGADKWDVAFDGEGSYTLRNATTGIYLGSTKADPNTMAPVLEGVSETFAWKIERGFEEEFFTLSPRSSNGAMRLAPSILRIFPPPVGWMPTSGGMEQNWRLVRV